MKERSVYSINQRRRLPLFAHARPIMHSILLVYWGERERAPPWEFNAPSACLYNWGERERVPPWEFNAPPVCQSVSLSVYIYIYIYISYVRHFWSRGPRATRKRKPAHLKFKGHMHACCICSKRQRGHHYTYRASTHVQQLSDNQQRRLEAETTHEREERLQQLSAAQVRS